MTPAYHTHQTSMKPPRASIYIKFGQKKYMLRTKTCFPDRANREYLVFNIDGSSFNQDYS